MYRKNLFSLQGFTLVELLVVISIITLLISILLPALSAARKSAQAIACASNERQIGIGIQVYSSDHDGWAPPEIAKGSYWRWPQILVYKNYLQTPLAAGSGGAVTKGVFSCPSESSDYTHTVNSWNLPWNYTNYGLNRYLWVNWSGHSNYRQARLSPFSYKTSVSSGGMLIDPSSTALLADSGTGPQCLWGSLIWWDQSDLRHSGAWNVLYFDLHVGSRKDVPVKSSPFWHNQP